MKIFLDDVRYPKDCLSYMHLRIGKDSPIYLDDWIIVRNYEEFKNVVSSNIGDITHVSFDHDLAESHYTTEMYKSLEEYEYSIKDSEETGYECAKFLIELYNSAKINLPIIFIHSMNPAGCKRIEAIFK